MALFGQFGLGLPCVLGSFLIFCLAVALFRQFGLGLLWVLRCVFWALVWLPRYTLGCVFCALVGYLGILSCVLGVTSRFLVNTLLTKKNVYNDVLLLYNIYSNQHLFQSYYYTTF